MLTALDSRSSVPATRPRRRLRKILLAGLILLIAGEIGTRLFWWLHKDAPPFSSETIWHAFYPEIRASGLEAITVSNNDATYDVLLLGGSVVSFVHASPSSLKTVA